MANHEQDRLKNHFISVEPSQHGNRWERLWQDGTFLPWDRGQASPALIDLLDHRQDLIGTAIEAPHGTNGLQQPKSETTSRRRALVPGCGTGYDVYLLQARGWDVLGLDISETALTQARGFQQHAEEREEFAAGKLGKGTISFANGNFFQEDERVFEGKWDLIWDYTFLCALPPEMRPKWAAQMADLLSPAGRLVCLEFPRTKDLRAGGPPWALPSETYIALLSRPGTEIKYDDEMKVLSEDQQPPKTMNALRRIAYFEPERTHAAGQGTDRVSVWAKQ